MRHAHEGKIVRPVPWSPLQEIDFDSVPVNGETHKNSLFMEDTAWPFKGGLQAYLAKAGTLYDHTLSSQKEEGIGMIELEAAFQPVLGTHQTTEVILWQRVVNTKAVMWMLGHDLPPEASAPGTWLHDALEVRDRWESRLRTRTPRRRRRCTSSTRHLAKRLAPSITVNAIAPGPFESKMMAATLEAFGEQIAASAPLRRIGRPDDMAGAAIYLSSRAGAYLTGTIIPVDGGIATTR